MTATSLSVSRDVIKSLVNGPELFPAAAYMDAVLDTSDILWIARSLTISQCGVTYSTSVYAPVGAAVAAAKVGGFIPVWLKCPEGTIYLFCGGKSYQLDTSRKNLLADTWLSNLAAIPRFWTWAWRGDELWIAYDSVGSGITLFYTRNRGGVLHHVTSPTPTVQAHSPRVVIAPTGEMAVIWWQDGSFQGALSHDYSTWKQLPPFVAAPAQWPGALFINQKLAVSYIDGDGTAQRIECDSLGKDNPAWV